MNRTLYQIKNVFSHLNVFFLYLKLMFKSSKLRAKIFYFLRANSIILCYFEII